MSTFDFYSYLNQYTPQLQAKALRLCGQDMELARKLYQRTASLAMQANTVGITAGEVEPFIDELMRLTHQKLQAELTSAALS